MFKKVFIIVVLAFSLVIFLVFRSFFFEKLDEPRLIDRLPSADFIGKINLLDFAGETSKLIFNNKLPFRDLLSSEFLLSQGKSYGLNFQKPIYIFGNERGDGGCFIPVIDSTKVALGIERLKESINISQISINNQKVFFSKKENVFLYLRSNFLFIYKGIFFKETLSTVIQAKYNGVLPIWTRFLNDNHFKNSNLVLYSNWSKIKENGIESAIFAYESDSLSFNLKSYFRKTKSFNLKLKQTGLTYASSPSSSRSVELHLDISELKNNLNDPWYAALLKYATPIGFPIQDFFKAWEGDLSFVEGGTEKIRESYIETELDENFNMTEVMKFRDVEIPRYSLYFSTNKFQERFINKLFVKGIMTSENGKIRVLYSPLLTMKKSKGSIQLFSGNKSPKLSESKNNKLIWSYKDDVYRFSIDSLNSNEMFGKINIPVSKILKIIKF